MPNPRPGHDIQFPRDKHTKSIRFHFSRISSSPAAATNFRFFLEIVDREFGCKGDCLRTTLNLINSDEIQVGTRLSRMERAAEGGEALWMAPVENTLPPTAMGKRTQPTLETENVPWPLARLTHRFLQQQTTEEEQPFLKLNCCEASSCLLPPPTHAPLDITPGFWEMYDPEGYSLWFCDYKYQDENTVSFVTLNKVGGFLQRMDLARKYAFGKMLIVGAEGPFKVKGLWLFRGTEVPQFIVDECYDMELYDWVKVDINDEAQGEPLLDAKCFQ